MVAQNIAELIENRVTLEIEGIDRMYLNAYQPRLQAEAMAAGFFKKHRNALVVSPALMGQMSHAFRKQIDRFAAGLKIELLHFKPGQRKDDVAQERLRDFGSEEGVVFIGIAQEKFSTFRHRKKRNEKTGKSYVWLHRGTVMCNHFYFYLVDEDFGPMFIKFSSYFPYTGRVCINGHEYAKRQLDKEGIAYEALDNGFLSCENPQRLQEILDDLDERKIEMVFRKWLRRLPHAFTEEDVEAGYRYQLSILQAEFALTQVFDRPLSGRHFFEEVIRENLDLGRPEKVSLIFDRRVTKRTPGRFRTRVITDGVIPSLHVSYKNSKIKQYFKLQRALRTETTINNTRDFGIGKLLRNLPALRRIGFSANRRLLDVQRLSHDCMTGEEEFQELNRTVEVDTQRGGALKFGDPRAMALMTGISLFSAVPEGFSNASLREQVALLMGKEPGSYKPNQMTYDLRRLRLHGLIRRVPGSWRYRVTPKGIRAAFFVSKVYARILRPGLSPVAPTFPNKRRTPLHSALRQLNAAVDTIVQEARLAA